MRDNCKHKWSMVRDASPNTNPGHGGEMYPAVFQCARCKIHLSAAEAMQVSALQEMGKQNYLTAIAIIISAVALIVSAIGPFFIRRSQLSNANQAQIEKCQDYGLKLYKTNYEVVTEKSATTAEYYYIARTNKCYLISELAPLSSPWDMVESIIDVYSNKVVLSSVWFQGTGLNTKLLRDNYGSTNYEEAKQKLLKE